MTFIFLMFGLAIAGFQTLVLKEIWQINLRPKWILFLITPLLITITDYFYDDQITAFVFFGAIASIFFIAVSGIIFHNSTNFYEESRSFRHQKNYNEVLQDYNQPFYLNPVLGIVYQLYVVAMIGIYIFVPNEVYKSDLNYKLIEQDLVLQLLSLFIFTGFSIIILLYNYLDGNKNYIPSIFTGKRLVATPKESRINKAITISITLISFIIFSKFCYDKGIYSNLKSIFQSFDSSSFLSINTGIIAFIIFNSIILIINPSQVAKRNMISITTLIQSAFFSIFLSAAIAIPFMILQDRLAYFNMSSEILLFLGFNIVLLVNEISLFVKYRKGIID